MSHVCIAVLGVTCCGFCVLASVLRELEEDLRHNGDSIDIFMPKKYIDNLLSCTN